MTKGWIKTKKRIHLKQRNAMLSLNFLKLHLKTLAVIVLKYQMNYIN